MRSIEKKMLSALIERKNLSFNNTRVRCIFHPHPVDDTDYIIDCCEVYLHDSPIARIEPDAVTINNCGWRSSTTKSRLNAILRELCGASISQRNFEWFLTTGDDVRVIEDNCDYTVKRVPMH